MMPIKIYTAGKEKKPKPNSETYHASVFLKHPSLYFTYEIKCNFTNYCSLLRKNKTVWSKVSQGYWSVFGKQLIHFLPDKYLLLSH